MAEPILHAKVTADGLTLTGERKRLDPDLVLPRAQAEALGKDFWLPVEQETQDTSTTSETVKTTGAWEIQANRVYRLTTIRDKTQAEIDGEAASRREEIKQVLTTDPMMRAVVRMIQDIATGNAPANPNTNAKMFAWIEAKLDA